MNGFITGAIRSTVDDRYELDLGRDMSEDDLDLDLFEGELDLYLYEGDLDRCWRMI